MAMLLRHDLEVTETSFGRDGSRRMVRAGANYFAIDDLTHDIIEIVRSSRSDVAATARISERLGRDIGDLGGFLRASLPSSWMVGADDAPVRQPLLWRIQLIGPRVTIWLARSTEFLFGPGWVLPVSACAATAVAWVLLKHFDATLPVASHPALLGLLTVFGIVIHEIGHASALARAGGIPRGIGFGLYWGFPTFYADVTEAWRFGRRQKILVDLAGVYFQFLYVGAAALLLTGLSMPALARDLVWFSSLLMVHTLNPALKLDGYWALNDILGRTNLHRELRRIFLAWLGQAKPPVDYRPARPNMGELLLLAAFCACCVAQFTYMYIGVGRAILRSVAQLAGPSVGVISTIATACTLLLFVAIGSMLTLKLISTAIVLLRDWSTQRRKSPRDTSPETT